MVRVEEQSGEVRMTLTDEKMNRDFDSYGTLHQGGMGSLVLGMEESCQKMKREDERRERCWLLHWNQKLWFWGIKKLL